MSCSGGIDPASHSRRDHRSRVPPRLGRGRLARRGSGRAPCRATALRTARGAHIWRSGSLKNWRPSLAARSPSAITARSKPSSRTLDLPTAAMIAGAVAGGLVLPERPSGRVGSDFIAERCCNLCDQAVRARPSAPAHGSHLQQCRRLRSPEHHRVGPAAPHRHGRRDRSLSHGPTGHPRDRRRSQPAAAARRTHSPVRTGSASPG